MDKEAEGPGMADDTADWEALARYLAGESPAPEAEAVRGWLAETPDRQAVLGALDRAMDRGATPPPADLDVEAALAHVHARMDAPETPVIPFRRPARAAPAPRRWHTPALRAAAAVLVLLGAYFAWQVIGGRQPQLQAYATGVGERDTVRLPDGSTVVLGPGSRLTHARGYNGRDRTVTLAGEALFQVRHDDARPFTVQAGVAQVRDIGTAFSVQSGPAGVRVVVTEGAVALAAASAPGREVVLRRGERGMVASEEGAAPQRAAATEQDLAWTRGELVFRDASLAEVEAELRRWYGVELRAEGEVAGRRLTASFQGELRGDTAVLSAAAGAPR
jgi:transmembrane sensor